VPINAAALCFLKPEKSTQASGFLNLARNVGEERGSPWPRTFQARSTQAHQAILSAHMSPEPAYNAAISDTVKT